MFLMLTPILACAMAFCPISAAKAVAAPAPMPCHQTAAMQEDAPITGGPMFALDCMGVDLFQADLQADFNAPDLSIDTIDYILADVTARYDFLRISSYSIRGPPFDDSPPYLNSTDLYLTTQRLRI